MLALTVKEGRWCEMMSPADASEVEESRGSIIIPMRASTATANVNERSAFWTAVQRRRTDRVVAASLSSQTTSEDSQEDGIPAYKRESKCKRCCCVPLTRLAKAFDSNTKQHAKTLQWRKANSKLKRTTHGCRSIDNTMLLNNTTLLNRCCWTSQHY